MLKPEDAEKVLIKDLANVIRKVHTNKPLTAAERALVSQAAAGATLGDSSSAFTKTYDELAQRLGLSRKTLQNAQKRHPEDVPRPRADGRHDIAAWSQFIIKHNVARSAEGIAGAASAEYEAEGPITVTDWRAREIELKCEKLAIENAKTAGQLILANDVEAGLSTLLAAARTAMNNLPGRLAQKVLHLADYHEAEELIQGEVDVVLRIFERCEFFDQLGLVNETVETASPVISTPAQVEQELADQRPAKLSKPSHSNLPAKGKPRGRAKSQVKPKTPPKKARKRS